MHKKILAFAACLFLLGQAFAQIDHYEAIVVEGQTWQYLVPSAEPNGNWRTLSFSNNPAWAQGPTGIGYGDNDDQTTITQTSSVYMRHEFNIVDTAELENLLLYVDFDDAYVAYLNGVEISRENIGTAGSPPIFSDLAATSVEALLYQGQTPRRVILPKTTIQPLLNQGTNVLAIQVHNFVANSSDLTAIPTLVAGVRSSNYYYQPTPNWFVAPLPPLDTLNFSSNLPLVIINTANGQTIQDDPKTLAQMRIIYNGQGQRNAYTDAPNAYNGQIGIETRGSSSQSFPKKPYGFETWDANQNDLAVSLLGMPAESDWILSANYSDKSLMNNVLSYRLFGQFGFYSPRTRYVELIVNGDNLGVYVLMEKIKRDRNRVDIAAMTAADTAGVDLTGGYIVKVDKTTGSGGGQGWTSAFAPLVSTQVPSIYIQYSYPDAAAIVPQQQAYVQQSFYGFENSLANLPLGDTTVDNWRNYADESTFIHYLILNELSKNVDGYRLSTFLHKDKDSRANHKWRISPPWDYDIAWGNADYCNAWDTSGWAYDFGDQCPWDGFQVPFWWGRLEQDSLFMKELKCRYSYLRDSAQLLDTTVLFGYIDSTAAYLDEAQQRNFSRWPILGSYVWPNPQPVPATYQGEIEELKTWIRNRLVWLDNQLMDTSTFCRPRVIPVAVEEFGINQTVQIYPNPTQELLHIRSEKPMDKLEIYNNLGQLLYTQSLPPMQTQFSLSNLKTILPQTGIYTLKIHSKELQKTLLFHKL